MHSIVLCGARTHNLKSVDLELAPGELVALTGPSGSGKSSLALDTLYSEGQRRFVESFSPYARQFLERLERPPVESLEPIAAAVAVDRRAPVKSSRSTLATMADLEPYLGALFTRESVPLCDACGVFAQRTDAHRAADRAIDELRDAPAIITYALPVHGTEQYLEVRDSLLRTGYRRLWIDGAVVDLDEVAPSRALGERGHIDVVVDRVALRKSARERLVAAVEQAWQHGGGGAAIHLRDDAVGSPLGLTEGLSCPKCARRFQAPRAGLFSYQSPLGACPTCRGFGRVIGIDYHKVIPDDSLSLAAGAIRPWTGKKSAWERRVLRKFCETEGIPFDRPFSELSAAQQEKVFAGEGTWRGKRYPGVRKWFAWLQSRTYKMHVRVLLARYRSYDPCDACGGQRLSHESLRYRVGGLDLAAWHALELGETRERLEALRLVTTQGEIARSELVGRLRYLERVGLSYLTLDRQARTLSGGEAQRVSLTAALGTSLTGGLFVLDEPTVGLHQSDIEPLVGAMRQLADRGNAVVVVEHDPEVVQSCDRAVELGPGAGAKGGMLVFDGSPEDLARRRDLPTGRAVHARQRAAARPAVRTATGQVRIVGARENNLRDVDVQVPLGVFVAITGPSGSGKSTLAHDILYRAAARFVGDRDVELPGAHDHIEGLEQIESVALLDQAPLGRTSRGNPATYSGAYNRVRAMFAALPDAKARGLTPGHFSFNVAAGRCEACAGEGSETIEMQFLADVSLICPTCRGRRFKEEVLDVKLDGRSIADVLALSVDEALVAFARQPAVVRALAPLQRLGLGYLALGQPLSTLSGGEAQRLKLARTLATVKPQTLVVLDEPSAGLHAEEIALLSATLDALVRAGATVVVVEHDLDVVAAADWVIELGPGAGSRGGTVCVTGPPERVAKSDAPTGRALRLHAVAQVAGRGRAARPRTEGNAAPAGIEVLNAREHNLKDVTTTVPHGCITVVTGPSGSGKSTLAFDVVFAEGQRRFLETLTPYARQFLPTLPRPDVDRVTGVPPSIALEQRSTRSGASSTVATVTEIAHYLRLLYAKVGEPRCPSCDCPVVAQTADEAFARATKRRGVGLLLAPTVVARKGSYLEVFAAAAAAGCAHAIADGTLCSTDRPPRLNKRLEHSIDIVVYEGRFNRIDRASFDRALSFGHGDVKLSAGTLADRQEGTEGAEALVSTARVCRKCECSVPELDPRWFSFNTKQGRCEGCAGSGVIGGDDEAIEEGADAAPCPECAGSRLSPLPRAVRLAGDRYHVAVARSVADAAVWAKTLRFEGVAARIAEAPHRELCRRLDFVVDVGLGYLSLDRRAATLSGGEMQRLRLAAQLGSGLTGALYVLDEPTIGLHPRDTGRLLSNLRRLADMGSTVLMVEHDADTIRAADHLIDLGPQGGRGGGHIVAEGPPAKVLTNPDSPTARALADERRIAGARSSRPDAEDWLELTGAREHNLSIDLLRIPAGRLTVVAGVSGSGKSTLVQKILYPAVRKALKLAAPRPGAHGRVSVPSSVTRAVAVDQSPIGRTPRSVPATFLGVWDEVRKVFAKTPEAKVRGFGPARFSFNTPRGGRCPACDGQGVISHEMSFLPDALTSCGACVGARFEPSTLEVRYLDFNIGEVLALSARAASEVFATHRRIRGPLAAMDALGVGYLQIGQGSHTLSGGEAQRLKLAAELEATLRPKPTLYVLDEPTTGLHLADVEKLIAVFEKLVQRGDTVVVIEHHPAVIACADWVVELGPEGGGGGGRIVAEGDPAHVASQSTATAAVLRSLGLGASPPAVRRKKRSLSPPKKRASPRPKKRASPRPGQ